MNGLDSLIAGIPHIQHCSAGKWQANTNAITTCVRCALEAHAAAERALREKLAAALDNLSCDNHDWSTRPCETCAAITELIGFPFGCDKKRALASQLKGS